MMFWCLLNEMVKLADPSNYLSVKHPYDSNIKTCLSVI